MDPSHFSDMEENDVQYVPLTFSLYGRVQPRAQATFVSIAHRAARSIGFGSHDLLLRRAMAAISVEIWRGSVAMIRHCLPLAGPEELEMLLRDTGPSTLALRRRFWNCAQEHEHDHR